MSKTKFVLIVEDEAEIRSLISDSIKSNAGDLDIIVVEAKDGREAIAFSGRQEFHCIITDLQMPRTTGEELIRMLLLDATNANTPTIVVSGNLSDEFLENFKNVRVIPKPFVPEELAQAVVREIKLGRMDERIPVHLLNPVLNSLQKIVVDDMKISRNKCELKPAAVRKPGEKIDGDFHATLTLTTGLTQAKIGLTYQREWLDWMRTEYFSSRRDQWTAMTPELTARQATLAVVEKAQAGLAAAMGAAPRVSELSVVSLNDALKAQDAAKSAGITVTLSMDQGQVVATAVAPAKVKRP